jgi:hypothetical protein
MSQLGFPCFFHPEFPTDIQIPVIAEKPIAARGWRKFHLDEMGDHLCTYTTHSDVKKSHDWVVDQVTDRFQTTHTVKTQHVTKHRGQNCGDIQLANVASTLIGD